MYIYIKHSLNYLLVPSSSINNLIKPKSLNFPPIKSLLISSFFIRPIHFFLGFITQILNKLFKNVQNIDNYLIVTIYINELRPI